MARRHSQRSVEDRPASWLSIAVVVSAPAVLLASLWQVADAKTPPPEPPVASTVPVEPDPELATDLMSLRRHPLPIAERAATRQASAELRANIAQVAEQVGGESCLTIVDPDGPNGNGNRRVLADVNPDTFVIPASNQKLWVAAVALEVLGPDFRYLTQLRGNSPQNGTITGDVFLIGGGDPLLTTPNWADPQGLPSFNTTDVARLVNQLKKAGVTRIEGAVVGVNNRYDNTTRSSKWGEDINTYDVANLGSLLINDGHLRDGGVLPNPAQAAAETFVDLLRVRGIEVTAGGRSDLDPPGGLRRLAAVKSAPMSKILVELMHQSDNTTAEMITKEIGFTGGGSGDWPTGLATIFNTLSGWGIDTANLALADGSGLSRENATRCGQLVELFEKAPIADQLVDVLPVGGRDGTLRERFIGTPAEGELQAKTGTLTGVRALSGQTPDATGEPVLFSVILNMPNAKDRDVYGPVWESMVEMIAAYPVTVEPDVTPYLPR